MRKGRDGGNGKKKRGKKKKKKRRMKIVATMLLPAVDRRTPTAGTPHARAKITYLYGSNRWSKIQEVIGLNIYNQQ